MSVRRTIACVPVRNTCDLDRSNLSSRVTSESAIACLVSATASPCDSTCGKLAQPPEQRNFVIGMPAMPKFPVSPVCAQRSDRLAGHEQLTAVDHHGGARHPSPRTGREQQEGAVQIARRAEAGKRNFRLQLFAILAGEEIAVYLGGDEAGEI